MSNIVLDPTKLKAAKKSKKGGYFAVSLVFLILVGCILGGLYPQNTLVSTSRLHTAVTNVALGDLGPAGSSRTNLLYYDVLFLLCMKYGASATRLLEVGCAADPFIKHLDWIDSRTCLAPYFATYDGHGGKASTTTTETDNNNSLRPYTQVNGGIQVKERNRRGKVKNQHAPKRPPIQQVTADFMEWKNPKHEVYELVVCNQVLEHVPDPAAFLKKLITTSKQATIVSVPYKWGPCGPDCGHLHHNITLDTIEKWAYPYKPVHHRIVTEEGNGVKRIFAVFQH